MECHRHQGLAMQQAQRGCKVTAQLSNPSGARHFGRCSRSGASAPPALQGGVGPSPHSSQQQRCSPANALPRGHGGYSSGEFDPKAGRRRAIMMKYVAECDPSEVLQQFLESAPMSVVTAMRQTVSNTVGSLPSAYFEVKVSTVADSLSQLFLTMARTGYLFASAQCRMELQATLNGSVTSAVASDTEQEVTTAATPAAASSVTSTLPSLPSVIIRAPISDSSSSSSSSNSDRTAKSLSKREGSEVSASGRNMILLPGEEQYAPGVQKRNLEGEVLRWSYEKGVERLAAADYVQHLEQQVATLKEMLLQVHEAHQQQQQLNVPDKTGRTDSSVRAAPVPAVQPPSLPNLLASEATSVTAAAAAAAAAASGSGELLEFLRGLPADSLAELTSSMCPEVLDAMDAFVARLMGTSDKEQLRSMSSEFNAVELSKVLLWLLVVGYALRTAEVRLETLSFSGSCEAAPTPEGASLFGFKSTPIKKGPWDGAFNNWRKLLPGGL